MILAVEQLRRASCRVIPSMPKDSLVLPEKIIRMSTASNMIENGQVFSHSRLLQSFCYMYSILRNASSS